MSPNTSNFRRRAHYILSSHWDREWYQSFQNFRYQLVSLLDKVLDRFERGALKGPFTCDGQVIILEDYLEIRPERAGQIRRYLKEGNLVAGPWYVLPDEFLVSGEALIRNIRLGRMITRELGGTPSNAGFVCDLFGHVSQLPQIMRGFGITAAIVWRGVNPLPDARFWWVGADGQAIPAIRFGKSGYCDYTYKVRRCTKHEMSFEAKQAQIDLRAFLDEESGRTGGNGPFMVFDGGDHLEMDTDHYRVLLDSAQDASLPYQIVHSDLDTFLNEMVASFGDVKKRIQGELREVASRPPNEDQQWLIPGVGSSRVWIKQQNALCQNLLCQWAEPFALLAQQLTGAEWPEMYLRRAWTWLLQNHPHDSLCGCSIDQVHEDMKYRFAQTRQIAERITIEALTSLAASVEGAVGDRQLRATVFNPLPRLRDEVVELTLAIPQDWPTFNEFFGFEPKPAFRILDSEGHELPYQRIGQKRSVMRKRLRSLKYPEVYAATEVTVALRLKLPATGFTTLQIVGRTDAEVKETELAMPTRYPERPSLVVSDHELENNFVRVSVESNGTLTILDKRTGKKFDRLLTLEDEADIGDGWYHGQAANNQKFTSAACSADVAITANGPLLATLRIRTVMHLPQAFDFAQMTRSEAFGEMIVEHTVSLRANQDFVEVVTRVTNTVRDHRLRVLFPSGVVKAKSFLADGAFDVIERPIALNLDNHLNRELEVEGKPQQSWTAVYDEDYGLAIVCDGGLLESGVRDIPQRPIILTLFRSTGRTVMTSGELEGQMIGLPLEFRYRIVPLSGQPNRTDLFDRAQELSGGIQMVQLDAKDVYIRRTQRTIKPTASLLRLDGEAVLTSLRRSENMVEVRFFNPEDHAIEVELAPGRPLPVSALQPANLELLPTGKALILEDSKLSLTLEPKQIFTGVFKPGKSIELAKRLPSVSVKAREAATVQSS